MKWPAQTIERNQPGGVGPDDPAGISGSQGGLGSDRDPSGQEDGCSRDLETREGETNESPLVWRHGPGMGGRDGYFWPGVAPRNSFQRRSGLRGISRISSR